MEHEIVPRHSTRNKHRVPYGTCTRVPVIGTSRICHMTVLSGWVPLGSTISSCAEAARCRGDHRRAAAADHAESLRIIGAAMAVPPRVGLLG